MLERRQRNFVVKMLLLQFLSIYFCLANNIAISTYEEDFFFLFLQYLPYMQDVPCIMCLVYMFPLLRIGYTSTFSYASSYS
jgi:hypothetical protein